MFSKWVPRGWFFKSGYMNRRHLTCNGWYSGLVMPISTIVGLLILYSYNVLSP